MYNNKKFIFLCLLSAFILGGFYLALDEKRASKKVDGDTRLEKPRSSKRTLAHQNRRGQSKPSSEKKDVQGDLDDQLDLLNDKLKALSGNLPSWMTEEGATFQDSRKIFGHEVLRSRTRHQWGEDSQLEIEITDIGRGADKSVVQALGFDLNMEDQSDEAGAKRTNDDENVITNYEYDFNDQAGSLMAIIAGRYMVEIQIQGLPEENFQDMLGQDIAFASLYQNPAQD